MRPGGPGGPVHIAIPPTEAKAGEPHEYPLPNETVDLLDLYLDEYRPRLCPESEPWLFPATGGGRKAQATLSQQISEIIKKKTGLVMTVHLFRHLAAKLGLQLDPGNFEGVRQLLGHKDLRTTTGYYIDIQAGAAAEHYDALLRRLRKDLPDPLAGRRHVRKRRP